MKQFAWLSAIILAVVALLATGSWWLEKSDAPDTNTAGGGKTVNIYNWGDYIDPDLIKRFEKETGYKVIYNTFDSNEAMYTKVKQGGTAYDVIVPSEYMVEKMINEDLLVKLDHQKLTGLDNYDPRFMDMPFDPGNQYSIPYFWGTLGIVYNDQFVKEGDIQVWDDLWKPEYRNNILIYDSSRDMLGVALASMGKSLNSKNIADLSAAKGKLDALMPNVKAILADEIKVYMARNEAALAVDYSGNAAEMLDENEHLHYVVPEDGGNLWFDNAVIPKTSKNLEGAYAFLNFLSDPQVNAQNTEWVAYATPNNAAEKLLPEEMREDEQWYPDDETMSRLEVYTDLGQKWTQTYNDLFLEFKMHKE
jgi:spermidine/putrescine transport system substrate-binding protein